MSERAGLLQELEPELFKLHQGTITFNTPLSDRWVDKRFGIEPLQSPCQASVWV